MGFHETVEADEQTRFEGYARELGEIQQRRAAKSGTTSRALHVKQHVGVVGELRVDAGANARAGIFAEAHTWPVYVRFSNGASARQADKLPDARGFAVKLVGVPGKKVIVGLENELTQDFLFIEQPALPFRDPHEFMGFVRAAKDGPAKLLPRLFGHFGLVRGLGLLRRLLAAPKVTSFATHAFHTGAPISFGETAAKFALFPDASPASPNPSGDHALRDDLVRRLRSGALTWTLRAQLFADDASTPIEDTSVVWSGPWIDLGKLTLPKQDPDSERGREISAHVEQLSFDPWHAVEAHRPLGAIMRARAVAYRESVLARKAAPEPREVLSLVSPLE